ncbi:MAG: resuscitation-promoting factor RpfA [Actinomycetota bacterium]|jgi:LysM repeat protein
MTRLVGWICFLAVALVGLHAATLPTADGDAVVAAFDGVRVLAMGLALYLLVTTVLGLIARGMRLRRAVRITDLVTVPLVRRLLNGAASIAVVAALAAPAAASAQTPPKAPPPVMHLIGDAPAAPPAPEVTVPDAPAPDPQTYLVRPGDSFWRISEQLLSQQLGRAPRDDEVVPAWRDLVAANADLVRDPNLVFVGQVLRVPAASVQPTGRQTPVSLPRTD